MTNIWLSRASQWGRTVAEFALAQGFVQATGLLTSLIYVRTMPVEQYAIYALCLTALSVAAVGSDLGLTGSLSYFWRKYAQSPAELAPMVTLVRRLRTILLAGSLAIAALMLVTSIRNTAASGHVLLICLALVAATAWAQQRNVVDLLLMRLSGQQRQSYLVEASGSAVRLGAAVTMVLLGIGTAWFGLLGGLLGALAVLFMLSRQTNDLFGSQIDPVKHAPTRQHEHELRRYALPLLPAVLVYTVQDPLVLWLAAVRAGPIVVAEVHALGRIAAIFAVIATFSYTVMTPRLARTEDERSYLLMCVLYSIVICGAIGAGLLVAAVFPSWVLPLLGTPYAHLARELLLSLGAAGLATLSGFIIVANRGRGWVALDTYFASGQLLAVITLCFFWRAATTSEVLTLLVTLNAIALAFALATMLAGIMRPGLVMITHGKKHETS